MRYLFLLSLLLFSCTKEIYMDAGGKGSGAIQVENFGAKGDGIADDTQAFIKAINSIPNRKKLNSAKKGYWGVYKAGLIKLGANKIYKITSPIVIPTAKNVSIISEALGSAAIKYEGPRGTFAFDFKHKGINSSIKVEGIQFFKAGIRLQGAMRGRIIISNNQFIETHGPAISIVDAKDVGTHPNSFGVVHWILSYNDFNYCQEGVHVDSKSILLGTIEKCRFNMTMGSPLVIDGSGILVYDCEFQSVNDVKRPYIHLNPKKNPISNIRIKENRFGSERAEYLGNVFTPPICYIDISDGKRSGNILIEDNFFFTTKANKEANSAHHGISIANRLVGLSIEDNVFRGLKKEIIVNKAKIIDGRFRNNTVGKKNKLFTNPANAIEVDGLKKINN